MLRFNCRTCGEPIEADISDPANPTAADFQIQADAVNDHIARHPEDLKTGMAPDPVFRSRDWVGCRCKGTCHCRPQRRS